MNALFLLSFVAVLFCTVTRSSAQTGDALCYATQQVESANCNDTTYPMMDNYQSTSAYLTAINQYYDEVCPRSECINPFVNLYKCLNITDEEEEFQIYQLYNGNCGQNGDDFCPVLILREYNESSYPDQLHSICEYTPFTSQINCDASSCVSMVTNFINTTGCCAGPYLGNLSTCVEDVTIPDKCGYVGGAGSFSSLSVITLLITVLITTILVSA